MAVIGGEGEEVSIEAPREPSEPSEPTEPTEKAARAGREPGAETDAPGDEVPRGDGAPRPQETSTTEARSERVKASPLARRIARERGIDVATISGTGPDGRVVAEDVEKAAISPVRAAPAAAAPAEIEVIQLTSIRKTIARRLTEAWEAPVFQLTVTTDATELAATRERMVELLRDGEVKPTVNDVLTRLVAAALQRHRAVNAQFVGGEIHRYPTANVGIAVATSNGLIVPVYPRRRPQVGPGDRCRARRSRRAGARRQASASGFEDGTFTISNFGMYGIEQFIAVLNPPQVAILAVGSIERSGRWSSRASCSSLRP